MRLARIFRTFPSPVVGRVVAGFTFASLATAGCTGGEFTGGSGLDTSGADAAGDVSAASEGGSARDGGASDGSRDATKDASVDGERGDGGDDGDDGGSVSDAGADAPPPGASCDAPDTYACAGVAQQVVLACREGRWQHLLDCAGDKLCDSTLAPSVSDRCAPPVAICAGHAPGDYVCDGANLVQCGPDLVTSTSVVPCGSARLCTLHAAGQCAACVDGEHQCSGAELKECAADHLSFVTKATCDTAALCNAGAGQCTSATCVAGQYRCTGADLERCNATQSGFDKVQTCPGTDLCNKVAGRCDACVPGARRCASTGAEACAADGSSWQPSKCSSDKPFCVGAGQCVACVSASDCASSLDPADPCRKPVCAAGSCSTQVNVDASCDDGDKCTSGDKCTAAGVCAGGSRKSCPATDQCHSAGTCNSTTGACTSPVKTGSCDDGSVCTINDTCSGAGTCSGTPVICNSPPDPQCQQATGTCDGNGGCTYEPKPEGAPCQGSDECRVYRCMTGACTATAVAADGTGCGPAMACKKCQSGVCSFACHGLASACICGNCQLPDTMCQ